MYCAVCGSTLPVEAQFCPQCGKRCILAESASPLPVSEKDAGAKPAAEAASTVSAAGKYKYANVGSITLGTIALICATFGAVQGFIPIFLIEGIAFGAMAWLCASRWPLSPRLQTIVFIASLLLVGLAGVALDQDTFRPRHSLSSEGSTQSTESYTSSVLPPPTAMQTQPEETATSKSVFSGEPKSAQKMDPKPLIQKQSIEQIRRRAFDLYSDNRYKEAAPLLDQDCNSGDAYACETLGYMYEIELGVPGDKSRATFLYAKTVSIYSDACDAGSAKSCESLNGLYEDREIIGQPHIDKHELPAKIKLFTKACDAGSSDGCFYLGNMYDSGENVVQDQARATMLFSKSCNGNMAWSCGRLGDNYLKGTGISKDLTKAKEFLTKGCTLGAQWACDEMKKVDQP